MKTTLTVKKVAEQAQVGIETVRFYEKRGLIPEPPRTDAGYRQYTPDAVLRLKFIRRAQTLGFTLSEIKELLALKVSGNSKRGDIRKRARNKIADIDLKIQALQKIKQTLEQITAACRGNGSLSGCPILRAMEEGDCSHRKV